MTAVGLADEVATDLHGHTRFSDGRPWPEDFVATRADHGLEVVAVSDHDVVNGLGRAQLAAQRYGVTLVPAMEVTSFIHFGTDEAEQIHILAYWPPAALAAPGWAKKFLVQRGEAVTRSWRRFVLAWLATVPEPERRFVDPDGGLAKLEGAEFPALQSTLDLIEARNPWCYEQFRRHHVAFWERDRELFGWSPEQAIEAIRGDGALDIVAHPVRVRDKARMDAVLGHASGHEVYTSRHKTEVAARFRARAEATGCHFTASSDDHGHAAYVPPPRGTPRRTVDRILGGR